MSISQMSTDKAFECMARMVPYVVEIAGDPKLVEAKKELAEKGGELAYSDFMLAVYPMLLCEHKDALYGIVAAMSDKTVDEVKRQPSGETFSVMRENSTKELFDFFPFAVRLAGNM